ncbi:MAG: O-antigen ligase family protein [Proteobacteria bacterium]|nr:O-antigen ligase family protein [Pseudomonadota bacterium]
MALTDENNGQKRLLQAFAGFSALIIFMAWQTPRLLAFGPSVIGLAGFFAYRRAFGEKPGLLKPALWGVLLIVVMAAVSSLWAVDFSFALERSGKLALVLIPGVLFISLAAAFRAEEVRPYTALVAAAVLVCALSVPFEILLDYPLYRIIHQPPEGKSVYSSVMNRSAVTAAVCLFPALAFAGESLGRKKAAFLFTIVYLFLFAVTESQSVQMAFALGLIFYFLFPYRARLAWVLFGAVIAAGMMAAPWIAVWMFGSLPEKLNAIPAMSSGGANAAIRMEIWDSVARYALQRPLNGFGIEATRFITDFDAAEIYKKSKTVLHPHNFILQIWIEFGFTGILCAVGMFLSLLYGFYKNLTAEQNRIVLPTFVMIFSVAMTGYGLWQGWWLGLMVLAAGLCAVAVKFRRDES